MSKINEIIEETGLELSKSTAIQNAFGNFYSKIAEWKSELPSVTVTAYDQGEKILKARELRLEVRTARLEITKLHKELKADALKEGRAIDAVKNFALSELEPLEEAFRLNENYIAIQEELRLSKLKSERMDIMREFESVLPIHQTAYEVMSEEDFQSQVKMGKIAMKMREEEEAEARKAEEERLRMEEQERQKAIEEQKAIAEKARAEAEQARKDAEEARKKAEEIEAQRKAEREAEMKRLDEIRAEGERRMKAIEEENEKREAERQAEWNAKLSDKLKISEESARENAELKFHVHDNQTGPDKIRLIQFAQQLGQIKAPVCTTDRGKKIESDINILLTKIVNHINEQIAQ